MSLSNLARDLQLRVDTVRRWLDILESLYFCFRIRPYSVTRDATPWFLVEVKSSGTRLSDSLRYFQTATQAPHALQAVATLPYIAG